MDCSDGLRESMRCWARALVLSSAFVCCLTGQAIPADEQVVVNIANAPAMGEKNAPVTIVEFSDYQCPLSGQHFNLTLKQLTDEYVKTGKVRYVYRDLPLESIHPLAFKAAEGAYCAREQDKFWEMHDRLFRNQAAITPDKLPLHAQMLNIDVAKFQRCLDEERYSASVRESGADARALSLHATPNFCLGVSDPNGSTLRALIRIEGAQSLETFQLAIEKLLAMSQPIQEKPSEKKEMTKINRKEPSGDRRQAVEPFQRKRRADPRAE